MKEQISLSIPTPCSEKWEEFSKVKDGAFCGTCCKTIIDFTKMSDDEVVQFFSNKLLNTCGRFRHDQIRVYTTVNIKTGFPLLKAGMLGLIMLLLNKESSAQILPLKTQTEFVQQDDQVANASAFKPNDYVIRGVVKFNDENETLPGVNINLKGTEETIYTDANGKFEFPRRLKEGDVLVFSFIGYKTQEFVVRHSGTEDVSISMEIDMEMFDDIIVMGEVRVADHPSRFSLRKLWVNIKTKF